MRQALAIICLIALLLSAIALIPGAIFIGLIFFVLPGLILIAAPNVLILSFAMLLGSFVFAPLGRIASYSLPVLLIAIPCFMLPKTLNEPLDEQIRLATKDDRDVSLRVPIDSIALLTPKEAPWSGTAGQECHGICLRLLFNGSVRSFLAGVSTEGLHVDPYSGNTQVTRYRVERRSSCPTLKVIDAGPWNGNRIGDLASDRAKARIAMGECLIAEPASLSHADTIIVDRTIKAKSAISIEPPSLADLSLIAARRLSAYQRDSNNVMQEVFRRTYVQAEPIGTPLLIGVDAPCSGGVCRTVPALYKTTLNIGQFEVLDFLRLRSGLNVDLPEGASLESIRALLGAALDDSTLTSDAPQFNLVDQYLKRLVESRKVDAEDISLLQRIILDERKMDLFSLPGAIRVAGERAAPLAEPLMKRIMTAPLQERGGLSHSPALGLLPPKAALPIMPQLKQLAEEPVRRLNATQALVRLADGGADGVPSLQKLLEITPSQQEDSDRVRGLWIAATIGLCRIGPEAAPAVPALLAKLKLNAPLDSLNSTALLTIATITRTGETAELEHVFDGRPHLQTQVRSQMERMRKITSADDACRY